MADKKHLIYIIDDDAMYAKMLSEQLKVSLILDSIMEAVDIVIFQYAELCEDQLRLALSRPDFIIVDYFLDSQYKSTKNGAAFVREINKKYPEIKLIMLSKQNDVQLAVDLLDEGVCDYVVKGKEAFKRVEELISSHVRNENQKSR